MNKINSKNILVIGDAMLDVFYTGDVSRISPEAPVPVFVKKGEKSSLGGAANVAANLCAARQNVALMAICGNDKYGDILVGKLIGKKIDVKFIKKTSKNTTIKTRFITNSNQQIMRMDVEDTEEISEDICAELLDLLQKNIMRFDLIVMSDYLKGVLSIEFLQEIIKLANKYKIRVLIDIKDKRLKKYKGAWLLKPNRKELQDLTGLEVKNIEDTIYASRKLLELCECKYVLTTCGADGMVLVSKDECISEVSFAKEVYDVTGAGDTVISYLAVCLANEMNMKEAITIANKAAGIQVAKMGTSTVSLDEIQKIEEEKNAKTSKVITVNRLLKVIEKKYKNKKIVFTNGCFDILHIGHIRYLQQSSELGDIMVVAVNSDDSVRRLKGDQRPINKVEERAELLCALDCVDYVVIFDEDTPYKIIEKIQPDVLVKGGDYKPEDIVGRDIVEKKNGLVKVLPYIPGKSTSNLIKRFKI